MIGLERAPCPLLPLNTGSWGGGSVASHRRERRMARAHWKYTVSTAMRITHLGGWPPTTKRSISAGAVVMLARPFTRKVSPTPGIRNSSATRGSATMLRRLSTRLLPRRSGSSRVRSSSTCTKPGGSPRGEASSPPGPVVASTAKGDASIMARYEGCTYGTSLLSEASPGVPNRASSWARVSMVWPVSAMARSAVMAGSVSEEAGFAGGMAAMVQRRTASDKRVYGPPCVRKSHT